MTGRRLLKGIIVFFAVVCASVTHADNPKREFRGAWLHTVGQNHFTQRDAEGNKAYLISQLDSLQKAGVNAVIFQVRPCADAFYDSGIEPWSPYLTGNVGKAPSPYWDPLEFMVEECHKRGMELHAWLNPYRNVAVDTQVPDDHITRTEPWRFVIFNKRYFFDPGIPENIEYIGKVVADILNRYDVDAIHMDDYFYPYPVKNVKFDDDKSYAEYGNGMTRDDWRRQNVNNLIENLSGVIQSTKPWVRFGISPFGIWRNIGSDPDGSNSNGLQNYDDLYADVILWAKNGWIDYQVPQLYWDLYFDRAPSGVLADWWNEHAYGRHLYIGQDVVKSMDIPELAEKIDISRRLENVQGNVWWPSVSVTSNYKGVYDELVSDRQSTPALVPSYPWLSESGAGPDAPSKLKIKREKLTWRTPIKMNDEPSVSDPVTYVIYRIDSPFIPEALDDPSNILAIVRGETSWTIPEELPSNTWLTVTALDRVNNESAPALPVRYKK